MAFRFLGIIMAALVFAPIASWADQQVVVTTASDVLDGDISSVAGLNAFPGADGKISLWEALFAVNNTPGTELITIAFDDGYAIAISFWGIPLPIITRGNVAIDAAGYDVQIYGNNAFTGIQFATVSGIQVRGLRFDGCVTGLNLSHVTDCVVTGCHFGLSVLNLTGMILENSQGVVLGGAAAHERNVFGNNVLVAVSAQGGSDHRIQNNFVGVAADGVTPAPNGRGIFLDQGAVDCEVLDNLISGNTIGIEIVAAGTARHEIQGNRMGMDLSGSTPLPNQTAIRVAESAADILIGGEDPAHANHIAHNTAGILAEGAATGPVQILGNAIHDNTDGGILLADGANDGIAAPVLTSVDAGVAGTASPFSRVEIFADDGGQGETFLEAVHASSTGDFLGTVDVTRYPHEGRNITATATIAARGTSEFSAPVFSPMNAPEVISITLADPSPTNQPLVRFTVQFSEAVTGVDTTGLGLALDGTIQGAGIESLSGSGDTYEVTVNIGAGEGTIQLYVHGFGNIEDLSGNPLITPYYEGPSYAIKRLRFISDLPDAVQAVQGDPVTFSVEAAGVLETLHYQWFKEDTGKGALPGAPDSPTITLHNVGYADEGWYYVRVSDGNESIPSNRAHLTVVAKAPAAGMLALFILAATIAGVSLRRRHV